MILIVGSNGHVGREIVKLAADQGLQTRCFDLAPADFSGLDTSSLESVVGDITDPAAVQQALKGVDTVMFVLGLKRQTKKLTHEMVEHGGMKTLIKAAGQTDVKHIMYISALGVSRDVPVSSLAAKWNTEQTLKGSGISYTIFRPSGYFVDFAEFFAPKIRENGSFTVIGDGQTRIQPLAPADLAKAFILSMDNPRAINQIFEMSGPEVFTLQEIIELVGRVVGRQDVRIKKLPFGLMNVLFSVMAFLTGNRGLKDFLYRMSRDSICSEAKMKEVQSALNITFQRLEPWLQKNVSSSTL